MTYERQYLTLLLLLFMSIYAAFTIVILEKQIDQLEYKIAELDAEKIENQQYIDSLEMLGNRIDENISILESILEGD